MRPSSRQPFSLKPSLLDRLTDAYPHQTVDAATTSYKWTDHLQAFRRDLSNLLNTRQRLDDEDLEERTTLQSSILTYGFPKTATLEWMSEDQQNQLARELTSILRRFEPRLLSARVTPIGLEGLGKVHFRIEGALRSDPAPIRVAFDTYLDVERTEYRVEGE